MIQLKDMNVTYIGKTHSIITIIRHKKYKLGYIDTQPLHLSPYALLSYICGFDIKSDFMFYIELVWK